MVSKLQITCDAWWMQVWDVWKDLERPIVRYNLLRVDIIIIYFTFAGL
jgi:hypothetical protein